MLAQLAGFMGRSAEGGSRGVVEGSGVWWCGPGVPSARLRGVGSAAENPAGPLAAGAKVGSPRNGPRDGCGWSRAVSRGGQARCRLRAFAPWATVRWQPPALLSLPRSSPLSAALRPFSLLLQTSIAHQVLHRTFSYCTALLRASVRKFCCKECTWSLLRNFFATRLSAFGQKRTGV